MQTEMMSDAIDDAIDNDEAEEETEELTNQVGPTVCIVSYFHIYDESVFTKITRNTKKKSYVWARHDAPLWLD